MDQLRLVLDAIAWTMFALVVAAMAVAYLIVAHDWTKTHMRRRRRR